MDSNLQFKYTIYKTTNKINDKMYIGCHKTFNPNDEYLGSGKILKRAIKKYGIENFNKEILFIFDTPQEMFDKEKEVVDKLFIESDKTYNILIGGFGGFEYVNSTGKNLYKNIGDKTHGKQNLWKWIKIKKHLIETGTWESWKQKVSMGLKEKWKKDGFHWTGRKHKEESKRKIGEKNSVLLLGEKNPNYGKCWIYSDVEKRNECVKKEYLDLYFKDGWKRGRKMNF